jgi:hypothetical protein
VTKVTRILSQIQSGEPNAVERLLPLVYDELRKLATAKLAGEKPGQTLDATGLFWSARIRFTVANRLFHGFDRKPVVGGNFGGGHGLVAGIPTVQHTRSNSRALHEQLLVR